MTQNFRTRDKRKIRKINRDIWGTTVLRGERHMIFYMKIEEMITDAIQTIESGKLTSHDHEICEQLTESNAASKPTR